MNPKLTVNLGLRWDYESPFTERNNKQVAGFCMTCTNPLQASITGLTLNGGLQYTSCSNRYPYPKDWNNIQPRIGFAYQVFPKTVFRAGYGIIYFNTLESPIGTGFSQTTSYNNYTGTNSNTAPINPLSAPFPGGVLLATGSSLGLATAIGSGSASTILIMSSLRALNTPSASSSSYQDSLCSLPIWEQGHRGWK